MKIVFLISSMKNGGAERVVANLSNSLSRKGYKISIVVFDEEKSDYKLSNKVILKSYKFNSENKLSTFFNGVYAVKKALNEIDPDIIISFLSINNIYAIIGNLSTKKPIIISERNDPNSDPKEWYYRFLRKVFYRFADGYVFQTKQAKDFFSSSIQRNSRIIQNPVFISKHLNKARLPDNKKNIVSVGRLELQKNYYLLIDAFSILTDKFSDYTLTIYGEGTQRKALEEYILKKGLVGKVSLPGRVNNVHEKIIGSAMFVLPSNYEGMSNALLEAMALGIPCISTDCPIGGSAELIRNRENGILVPVNDVEKMAEAMSEILSNQYFAEKLRSEAKKVNESNTLSIITRQWEELILEINKKNN